MKNKIAIITTCLTLTVATFVPDVAQGAHKKKGSRAKTLRAAKSVETVQTATVSLTGEGYQPASLKLKRGVPARITFVRRIEETCGKEIAIPNYNIRRALPLNQAVVVEFTPEKTGDFNFTCGMGMLRGKVVVQ